LRQVPLGQTDLLAREQFLDPGGDHDITFVKAAADDDRVALWSFSTSQTAAFPSFWNKALPGIVTVLR
jgi:hypothetical protein